MSDKPISDLHRRMIADMAVRSFGDKTRHGETEVMVEPLRRRQTKEAETDMFGLPPPRHISTPPPR